MATNGNHASQEQFPTAPASSTDAGASTTAASGSSGGNNMSKDEVGWFFVEQYYTTLSKSPEKLHLFYGKRSQFVYGVEAEVTNISVGRQAIQERIAALDFQDCKVRISNVDSQASFDCIVIQVIGETSNKAGEPKKFVQTFILAQQPSGYFVLNDILRYIDEANEEPAEAEEANFEEPQVEAAEVPAPAEAEAPAAKEDADGETSAVEQKLQDVASATETAEETTPAPAVAETKPAPAAEKAADPETAAREIVEEDVKEPEKPQDPSPTPIAKPAAPQPEPKAAEPAGPPKPMTWASRAAAAAGPRPVVPLPKTATPPAPAQSRAPAPAAAAAAAPAAAPAAPAAAQPAAAAPAESANKEASGWQTAGADAKRQNRPQSVATAAAPIEKEGTMGYVKYVTDKVQDADLRGALAAHGELTYFDINRSKNCAFVEYKTIEGYQAAVSANPHIVNGENIVVEPRRPKSTAYGGSNYGSGRGGASGRGRGGFEGNRTGGQGNPRGNFSGQSRGRGGAPRGRGASQAAA
jgi:hypothetical protein